MYCRECRQWLKGWFRLRVKELAALLATFPPESTILLSRDAEGNGFGVLAGFDVGTMIEGSPGPLDYDTTDDDDLTNTNCVVFYPS